ncbi:MAG: hypothetical protein ACN6O5_19805 [Achromobacter sp.]|uniref:hypothetical protein n=1 Tax=Achromobacter sp. TaxID=134375 RepID=UPI003D0821C3
MISILIRHCYGVCLDVARARQLRHLRQYTKAAQQQAQRDQNMMLMMPYTKPPPTTTDCYRYGNAVRCTTR